MLLTIPLSSVLCWEKNSLLALVMFYDVPLFNRTEPQAVAARPVFTRRDLLANNIKHLYASINWKNVDKTYSSWTDARDAVNQKAAEKKEYEKKVAEAAKKGHQIGKLRAKIKVR